MLMELIADRLAGKRIAVTGATGFLGTALVERLLRSVPGCEVVVLVRPGQRQSAAERTRREIVRNDCFDRLRRELGDRFDREVARRLTAIPGDVSRDGLGLDDDGRKVLAGCDIVIHSAATVSFDAPLDGAVEVNLLGPSRVATTLLDLTTPGARPHLVAVSTAYVNSGHKGDATEELITASRWITATDWRSEVDAARRARTDADSASRHPDRLRELHKRARAELGAAGTALLAERTERLREDFVRDAMVRLGRSRAQALGWPDAYAFTKSLGERALLETRGDLPLTFVRPSIVESALAEPHPGWIRGFRMAEPVIISYARGLLRQFPGVPEGIIDVVPVDLVVAAIVAVAAEGPAEDPTVYQVASGARNPLRYGELVRHCEGWFTERPLYDSRNQPIVVPKWSFPGRGKVQGELRRATKALKTAERALTMLPIRGERAEWVSKLEERRAQAERALDYVELYGAYTETAARFRIDRTLALFEGLAPEDRDRFSFDPAVVDWARYIEDVHLPSVVAHARVKTAPGSTRTLASREERARTSILSEEPRLAVFDLENTLMASNVVESYSWLATRHLEGAERARVVAGLLAEAPQLLALDRRDRSDFLRSFYRRYEGAPVDRLRLDAVELWSDFLALRAFPDGLARLREHRALGHTTLLITGALDFIVEPLAPLFDEIVCATLGERDGTFTGEMVTSPPTGEARAILMEEHAARLGLGRDQIVAYADSTSDLPMLEAAGLPVVVNPEAKLAAIARRRGWPIEQWDRTPGGPRRALAVATLRPGTRSIGSVTGELRAGAGR
jgi:fatty acyl-CoA reductase